jgi:regulatory protein
MTPRDDESGDDLAPVTPLFGVRGGRSPSARSDSSAHPSRGRGEGQAGDEKVGLSVVGRDDESGEPDEPTRETVASTDPVLETAAALAAISDHWSGDQTENAATAGFDADEATDEPPEDLEAQRTRAENISLHALSRRGVSSSEMASLLAARDLDPEVVDAEVSRLEGVGLLNDRELAENLVRAKQERKGLGRGAVTSELRSRGIDPGIVDEVLAETDDDDEQARADEWARKRAGSLRGLDQATAERRLNGYLMRRGYRSETVRRAVEKALPRGGGGRGGVRFQ